MLRYLFFAFFCVFFLYIDLRYIKNFEILSAPSGYKLVEHDVNDKEHCFKEAKR